MSLIDRSPWDVRNRIARDKVDPAHLASPCKVHHSVIRFIPYYFSVRHTTLPSFRIRHALKDAQMLLGGNPPVPTHRGTDRAASNIRANRVPTVQLYVQKGLKQTCINQACSLAKRVCSVLPEASLCTATTSLRIVSMSFACFSSFISTMR